MSANSTNAGKSERSGKAKQIGTKKIGNASKQALAQSVVMPVVPNKDLFHRINFSYQASIFLQSLGSSSSLPSTSTTPEHNTLVVVSDRKGKKRALEQPTANEANLQKLARLGMKECNTMIVHNQLKLDPSIKRSICKVCGTVLVPGLTARIRNRPNKNTFHKTSTTCLSCISSLSIPAPPIPPFLHASSDDNQQLDGPVRKKRREKAMGRSKAAFHEKESDKGRRGHTMWKDDTILEGWGLREPTIEAEPAAKEGDILASVAANGN